MRYTVYVCGRTGRRPAEHKSIAIRVKEMSGREHELQHERREI